MSRARIPGREKWKYKKWFVVTAPPVFGEAELGIVPADEEWKLVGRTVEATMYDLTGDISQLHIRLKFQITGVDGERAATRFKQMELARDYLRSLTRRKSSKISGIIDLTTKDGYGLRVFTAAFTAYRCKASQKEAIRKIMFQILSQAASEKTLDEFIKACLGEMQGKIFEEGKKIYPLRKVEIAKIKLLTIPTPSGPAKAVIVPQRPA